MDISGLPQNGPKSPIFQPRQSNFYTEGVDQTLKHEYHIPINKNVRSNDKIREEDAFQTHKKTPLRKKISNFMGFERPSSSFFTLGHNLKPQYKIYHTDYIKRKLRKHTVVEIFKGRYYRWECQCSELLQAINSHSTRSPHENDEFYSPLTASNNQDNLISENEDDKGEDRSEELSLPNSDLYVASKNYQMGAGKLTYRDCRQVLTDVQQTPSLEVRRHCVVICLPPVTCFILHDRVFLLIVEELRVDSLIQQLMLLTEASSKVKTPVHRPFEFLAIECLISAAFEQLNDDILSLEENFYVIKMKAQQDATSVIMEELYNLKQPVDVYKDRVKGFDKAFNELIADTEDLKQMELSLYFTDPDLYNKDRKLEEPNQDLLILLEYFDQELDQFHNRVNGLYNSIGNTDRLLSLRLSINRNKLIKYDLGISILEASIAIGTCISGIFGMNLATGLESRYDIFILVAISITITCCSAIPIAIFMWKRIVL